MAERRLRVAFLLPSIPAGPGGGTRVVFEYANRLVARGHEVLLAMPRRPAGAGGARSWVRQLGAGALRPALGPDARWQRLDARVEPLRIPSLQPRFIPRADALIATSWPTAEALHAASPRVGQGFYLIQGYETWSGPASRVEATWRLPFPKIVVAGWLLELGRRLGARDLHCITNAVDHTAFRLVRPIDLRPKCVAMMVSHQALKGSKDGIAALELARREHPDLEVVLFGKLPICRHPRWMDYRWNPPLSALVGEVYNRSRIFVCPSWEEGFGLPGAEAMSCGCALVSTDCLGVREYASHGVTALLSPPKDVVALARNLVFLLRNDLARQRFAAAGAAALASFDWEERVERFEELLLARCRPWGGNSDVGLARRG